MPRTQLAQFAHNRGALHHRQSLYPQGSWQDEAIELMIAQEIGQMQIHFGPLLGWQPPSFHSSDPRMTKLMYRNYRGTHLPEWRTREQVRELKRMWQWKRLTRAWSKEWRKVVRIYHKPHRSLL
jgi:V8-like Glu-specific endopeptidase